MTEFVTTVGSMARRPPPSYLGEYGVVVSLPVTVEESIFRPKEKLAIAPAAATAEFPTKVEFWIEARFAGSGAFR